MNNNRKETKSTFRPNLTELKKKVVPNVAILLAHIRVLLLSLFFLVYFFRFQIANTQVHVTCLMILSTEANLL